MIPNMRPTNCKFYLSYEELSGIVHEYEVLNYSIDLGITAPTITAIRFSGIHSISYGTGETPFEILVIPNGSAIEITNFLTKGVASWVKYATHTPFEIDTSGYRIHCMWGMHGLYLPNGSVTIIEITEKNRKLMEAFRVVCDVQPLVKITKEEKFK